MAEPLPIQPDVPDGIPAPSRAATWDDTIISMSRNTSGSRGVFAWLDLPDEQGGRRQYKLEVLSVDHDPATGEPYLFPWDAEILRWVEDQDWKEAMDALSDRWRDDIPLFESRQAHREKLRQMLEAEAMAEVERNRLINIFVEEAENTYDAYVLQVSWFKDRIAWLQRKVKELEQFIDENITAGKVAVALSTGAAGLGFGVAVVKAWDALRNRKKKRS